MSYSDIQITTHVDMDKNTITYEYEWVEGSEDIARISDNFIYFTDHVQTNWIHDNRLLVGTIWVDIVNHDDGVYYVTRCPQDELLPI